MASASFDLRLVAPFAVLGEELHLGRAAARLGTSPAALAQQIARLERQVKARLVDRDGRKVTLTPAGARFLVESRDIVSRAVTVESALRDGGVELRVHLGDPSAPTPRQILASFLTAHPTVRMRMAEGSHSQATQALLDGEADVAFDLPQGVPIGLSYAPVDRTPLGAVSTLDHPIARRGTGTWSDVDGETIFLAPPGIADGWNILLQIVQRRAGIRCRGIIGPRVNQALYLISQLAAGEGLLLVAEWVLDPLPPELGWTRLDPVQELEIGIVWDDRTASETARRFVAWATSQSRVDPLRTRPPDPDRT